MKYFRRITLAHTCIVWNLCELYSPIYHYSYMYSIGIFMKYFRPFTIAHTCIVWDSFGRIFAHLPLLIHVYYRNLCEVFSPIYHCSYMYSMGLFVKYFRLFTIAHTCIVWDSLCENLILLHAINKGTYKPVHPHSLISAFVIYSQLSMISKYFQYSSQPI